MRTILVTLILGISSLAWCDWVDLEETFRGNESSRFFNGVTALVEEFDNACGDTWCEGDYGNLQSMSFDCSADKMTRKLSTCIWQFAGSYRKSIHPKMGWIAYQKKFFNCRLPVDGTVGDLVSYMDEVAKGSRKKEPPYGLDIPLPGSKTPVNWVLSDCL